jgi:hypothetical protein
MKYAASLLCLAALLAASPSATQVRDETILTYEVVTTERKALVMEALDINQDQIKALSPIYDAYLAEVEALDAQLVDLIKRFLGSYKALEDPVAQQMIEDMMEIDQAELDLKKYYTRRFGEVLPARKVLRLWQIENKLDVVIEAQLVKDIPLAK